MKFVRSGVAEDSGFLRCYAVLLVKYFLIFQMHYKPTNPSLSVKNETYTKHLYLAFSLMVITNEPMELGT